MVRYLCVILVAWLPGCAKQKGEVDIMNNDPFFNRVSKQLIDTPDSSLKTIKSTPPDMKAGDSPRAWPAETSFKWTAEILREKYAPVSTTPFIMFPKENMFCDIVRAFYKVDHYEIEIAQSRYLFSIKISGFQDAGKNDLQIMEKAAAEFLRIDKDIQFQVTGKFGQAICIDDLHWWRNGQQLGFITIKASGGPTREVIVPDEMLNQNWFQ
jgi:hypothetical protein